MQSSRKKLGIFIIIVGLILIILIIYFTFFRKKTTEILMPPPELTPIVNQLPVTTTVGTTTPSDKPRNYQQYNIDGEATHKINETDLGKISMSFAERFGSYSNQSNYGNFTDLKIFMTDTMKTWADKYVADLKSKPQNGSAYYGIVSQALTYEIKKFDDKRGQADILIATQRRESTESINGGEPYIQNLNLSLMKVNGEWLFDKAYWETK